MRTSTTRTRAEVSGAHPAAGDSFSSRTRVSAIGLLLLSCVLSGFAADGPHLGLLLDSYDLTLSPGHRTEGFGPLTYHEEGETLETYAVPPLFSHVEDAHVQSEELDVLYPLFTYDRFGHQYRFQFFQIFTWAGGETQVETNRDRFSLFPIYFQQRSSDPMENYTMVFPIYGRLAHRLFRDEIWVYSPFYIVSRKKDVITQNFVYPFFHLRHGDALEGWQFWPFVGYEHKDVTRQTNSWGDIETIGAHDKTFVLWPFYGNEYSGLGTDNPSHDQFLLPFYDQYRSPTRDTTSFVWPFINIIDDRAQKYHEVQAPWPLVEFARGEGKTANRVIPLFGHSRSAFLESDSYLWPVYTRRRTHSDPLDRTRTRILFFLYSDTLTKNTETHHTARRTDFLPLFSREREFNGNTRFQTLAILEPIFPASKSVARNYGPLWTLWLSESNARTHASSQSLLWNLYRHESAPETSCTSMLFGLFQYKTSPKANHLRLFYIPF